MSWFGPKQSEHPQSMLDTWQGLEPHLFFSRYIIQDFREIKLKLPEAVVEEESPVHSSGYEKTWVLGGGLAVGILQ